MPQSATPATRNEATSHLTRPDYNAFCNFSYWRGHFLPRQSRSHMSQSATPATQNEATQLLKHQKITPFATFPIGTATFCHDGRPQTVANGCRRLQTVANIRTASSEHTSTRRPPKCKTGTLRYAFGKNIYNMHKTLLFVKQVYPDSG